MNQPTMPNCEVFSFANGEMLARAAAGRWIDQLAARRDDSRPVCLALSGGRIARAFFTNVADQAKARGVSLSKVHFFWADERCVPPGDAESNFALARSHLLDPLRISPEKIHRIRGEVAPNRAAAEAEAEICRIAPLNAAGQPVLDLIFLGMGEDGHVASLFPGAPDAVVSCRSVYLTVGGSKPPPNRITLSFATLAAARQVWVLASGPGKTEALRKSLSPDGETPLARVLQSRQDTLLFTDIAF